MPSKKRKYNARFPAGRIKKIMQTDEEVGKVAQAVPIIISRTLELFVESLLSKAMFVTVSRNAKTLSPSHVKQCIFAESRFDFLRDLVKNIPDVSAAEEKEMLSAESSPNSSSRYSDVTMPTRSRLAREDSSSSSGSDVRYPQTYTSQGQTAVTTDPEPRLPRTETITSNSLTNDSAIDLSTKTTEEPKLKVNFYQETLNLTDDLPQTTVITPNPYAQPSTSSHKVDYSLPKTQEYRSKKIDSLDLSAVNNSSNTLSPPVLKIDFSKSMGAPEIKVLNSPLTGDFSVGNASRGVNVALQSNVSLRSSPIDVDSYSSGNLQIDEDYDT